MIVDIVKTTQVSRFTKLPQSLSRLIIGSFLLGRVEPNTCRPHHVLFGALLSLYHSCSRSYQLLSLGRRSRFSRKRYAFIEKVRIGLLIGVFPALFMTFYLPFLHDERSLGG